MTPAFKHLQAKLRFGELTVGQWAGVVAGVGFGLLFAQYLSPVDGIGGVVLGVYLGAIPASAALFASVSEFDLWGLLFAAARRQRRGGRFLPGGGAHAHGYVLLDAPADREGGPVRTPSPSLDELWG